MKILLALVLILIFICIASIHIYWALGGKKWILSVIPTLSNSSETPLFEPRIIDTIAVAVSFLLFAWVIGMKAKLFALLWFQPIYLTYITFGITFIFLLRAIGEFKYVGFFKKVKETTFAQMDSHIYSPLCLSIGIIVLIINFL